MKLSTHYSRASIVITIAVLLIGSVIYYFTINYIATNQLDRDLTEEIDEVNAYVDLHKQLPSQVDFDEDITVFTKTNQKVLPRRFFDTIYNNVKEKEIEKGRAVSGLIMLNGEYFKVTISESRESTEYLITIIAIITLLLSVGLLIVLVITNKYILNGLWKPFYKTLNGMKIFNVSDEGSFVMPDSKVDEFNELNRAVQLMSSRVKNDFQNLKHFTENASHEMLTPLAVITSKLDTLIQDETIKPEQYDQINDIYAATSKLSRLNQSLLLLVKIENNLIEGAEWIDLDSLIAEKVRHFQDILVEREISATENLTPKKILVSKYLVDILLNNLFSNAIRHNHTRGELIITLTQETLTFQNNGLDKPLDERTIFERFQKNSKSEGTGLGLSIVKNIAHIYGWSIHYDYKNSFHTFQIRFQDK
jgi:signal transduction histidine kinase